MTKSSLKKLVEDAKPELSFPKNLTFFFRYKRRIRRSNIKIVEAPVRALIPASLPPGSVMGPAPSLMGQNNPSINGSSGRIYEWQETAMPIDTASYRSLPR